MEIDAVCRPYDYLLPILAGQVGSSTVSVKFDFSRGIGTVMDEPRPMLAELSLAKYCLGVANGSNDWAAIPMFPLRGFLHRWLFVRVDSDIRTLGDLASHRVGANGWIETGNTYLRAVLRQHGIDPASVTWVVGRSHDSSPAFGGGATIPDGVETLDGDDSLVSALLAGRVDVVFLATPPPGLRAPGSGIRRIYGDAYPAAESAYFETTKTLPMGHVLALREDVATPELLSAVYDLMRSSWKAWHDQAMMFNDAAPWVVPEMERAETQFGPGAAPFDWQISMHARSLELLSRQQAEDGLAPRPVSAAEMFPHFPS